MKKIVMVALITLLAFSIPSMSIYSMYEGTAAQELEGKPIRNIKTGLNYTVCFSLSDLSFSKVKRRGFVYDVVGVSYCPFMSKVGGPMLPVKGVQLVVPPDAKVGSVTVLSFDEVEVPGIYNIFPAQPPQPVGTSFLELEFVEPCQAVYASTSPYPGALVECVGDGFLAGYHIVTFSVYPLQYLPLEKKLVLYTTIKFIVNLEPSTDCAIKVERRTMSSQELYEAMVKSLVENPSDVETFSPKVRLVDSCASGGFEPSEFPSTCGSPVEYVIITADGFVADFQTFACWKTLKGVPAVVRTVSWIEANYPGCDLQERIRNFIKEAYSKWGTQWVLLGGDTDIIPDRKVEWNWFESCDIPTDLYYSDLDREWNGDGDAYFGEANDNVDLTPDLFVGRAPVETSSEVAVFVNKILTYEKNPNPTYITDQGALFMAVQGWSGASCKQDISNNLIPGHISVWKLYDNLTGDHKLNSNNALYRMNMGYHFINHVDHSSVNMMGTDIWGSPSGGNIGSSHMDSLTNDGNFSILWTMGCSPNAFDHDSISEHFILSPGGGGVAFLGNTREGLTPQTEQDKRFFRFIFDDAFFDYSLHHIGMAFASTQGGWIGNVYSYLMNLLGDPEMPVWTNAPSSLALDIQPSAMLIGPHSVTVSVKDASTTLPVENATVCLYKEGEVYAYGETDASGTISFTVKPDTPGMAVSGIRVTLTAQNYLPYEGTISIYPIGIVGNPYLYYMDHDILDAGYYTDGVADAGETITIPVTLRNIGTGDAINVGTTLSLCTADPYVTITDDYEAYGNIAVGATATCPGYVVDVSPDCPDEHEVEFCLMITDAAANVWEDEFRVCVMAPNPWHSRNGVYDITWPNGVIEPGETVQLSANITNGKAVYTHPFCLWAGHGAVSGLTATLSTTNPDVTITQNSVFVGDILAKEEKMSIQKFQFVVSSTWTPSDLFFTLTMIDSIGRSWIHDFELTPPEAPTGMRTIPGEKSITLAWNPNTETDLAGYNIYLLGFGDKHIWAGYIQPPKLNILPVTSSRYTHNNLVSGVGYEYLVVAVDSSGNEGGYFTVREWPNPKDHPGWPKTVGTYEYIESSPAIVDLDGNLANGLEIVVASFWKGIVYAWHHNGNPVNGWPINTGGWPAVISSSPAIGDIDDDGDLEVLIGAGNKVYAWHHNGVPVSGWPITVTGSVASTPAIADVDQTFSGLEVVVTTSEAWVYVFRNNGQTAAGSWPVQVSTTWGMRSSPAVGDIDGDNEIEIVVVGQENISKFVYGKVYALNHDGTGVGYNWPAQMGCIWQNAAAECAPALGDIDNDNEIEIVTQDKWRTYVWDYMGNPEGGWQGGLDGGNLGDCSPALCDLDNDGDLEIVVGSINKKVYARHHDGTLVNGWPQETKCGAAHNPIIGDLDGDGEVEILVSSDNEKVYAWHKDGTRVLGWPIKTGWLVKSTPALGDIDLDGDVEVVVGSYDSNVYLWDCDCAYKIEWGTFRHDAQRTGFYSPHDLTVVDVTPSKTVVGQSYPTFINATITNEGRYTETFNVTIYANTTIIATLTNITLESRNSTALIFTWNTSGFAKGNYATSAYIWPIPGETDTTDNTFVDGHVIVAMPGDITGSTPGFPDGKVDIRDIATAARAFESYPGHPRWDPNCDINNDLKVNIIDIAAIARQFGKTDC